ncbi:hypothetical protein NPIL_432411 [Nephila pilipes]|uniref:Uncharacterized protein n=1 Tax=Nephila pilipes TaxID=299642 RepID=A0A8X6TZS1_NEPPI|nr:hypothetical protein NPIL_432411 [Nephila pilipes]
MKRRERKPWWRFRSDSDVLIDRLIRIFGMHICGSSDGSDWECRDGERRGEGVSLPRVSIDAGITEIYFEGDTLSIPRCRLKENRILSPETGIRTLASSAVLQMKSSLSLKTCLFAIRREVWTSAKLFESGLESN